MEAELLRLQENNDVDGLQEYIQNLKDDFLYSELNKICIKENGAFVLQILFNGVSATSSNQDKRIQISRMVLENIKKKVISLKLTEKLVSVLATQMTSFSAANIITLLDICLQMMRETSDMDGCNCWKDFIPKLLNKIIEEDFIEHNGSQIKGSEYKSEVVITICHYEWPDNIITNIASMFIDMPLSCEEHLKVVNKLCKTVSTINLEEIPPLVHQMLQLTKEQHFIPLFLTLSEIFDERLYGKLSKEKIAFDDPANGSLLKEIQTIEGTVLYHIFATVSSLGPQSVRDFLKTLKDCVNSPAFILSPFSITFLLTISSISYVFEEEILSLIKGAILRNHTEEEKISDSAWIETVVPPAVAVDELLDKIIQNWERDKVVKGLINLGFSLLAIQKTRGKESQCDKIWSFGSSILVRLLNKHGNISSCLLQMIANQITQAHESAQYTDCLAQMVRKSPLNVLDSSVILIQLLDNICGRLPGNVGKRVVMLILPLTKMSQSLRDNLIIVLRKSLFPQDKLCREMAVTGIIQLLKDLKISNLRNLSQSISQPYCSLTQMYSEPSAGQDPSHSNEGLCLELLSMLREVFKHQEEVKIVFYRGIYEAVYVNPELGCHALDYLQTQLDKFFKPGNDLPPLYFEKTVTLQSDKPLVQEPLAELVLSVGLIVSKMEEGNTRSSKLREMFDSLCERMSNSDIPHLTLGKVFDGSPESLAKEEEIRQILGVYEALIGYTLSTWTKDSKSHGEMLNSLFRGYCRLCDFVRGLGKADRKKPEDKTKSNKNDELPDKRKDKTRTMTFRFPPPVLNYKCAYRLLSVLNESSIPWASDESVSVIKNKRELHRYCFNVILSLIKQTQSLLIFELSKNNMALCYLTKMGRIIFTKCVNRIGDFKAFDLQSTVTSVECFTELLQLGLAQFKGKFSDFLNELSPTDNNVKVQLKNMLDVILDQLRDVLKDDLEEDARDEEVLVRKLSVLLITIANCLTAQLPRGPELQQALDKIKGICKEIKVESPNVAKSLLTLLLSVYLKYKPSGSLLLDLTLCLCESMTLIDDEMNVEDHIVYAVINEKTANACVVAVCDTLRVLVSQLEWLVTRLKAELLILSLTSKNQLEMKIQEINEKERELCRHVNFSMKVLSLLCTIAAPPGIYADAILKEIGNFYNKLTIVTKYFILKVGRYHQQLHNSKFDKTVKMVDHELSKNMYCFTEHVIADGAASVDDKLKKQKDPTVLKNKCLRETKIIPKVIYEKEQFQKYVLQLSNKSKVNLVGHTKHTLARDYRLYTKQVKEILEKENIELESEENYIENMAGNESGQSSKRQKLSD